MESIGMIGWRVLKAANDNRKLARGGTAGGKASPRAPGPDTPGRLNERQPFIAGEAGNPVLGGNHTARLEK
jgi:hypothetical protein